MFEIAFIASIILSIQLTKSKIYLKTVKAVHRG